MKLYRIYGSILHYFYIFKSSPDRITDVFYWPSIDIILWGLTSAFIAHSANIPHIVAFLLSGVILWTVVFSAQRDITFGILEELWNKNLINLFTTPLKFSEWVTSIVVIALVRPMISFLVATGLALLLYQMNVFAYGFYLLPFIALLLMMAWSVGFFVSGLILRYTSRIQTLAWSTMALLSPFSAIYYSVSTLPAWAQKVAMFIPASYIFEGMREVILKGTVDISKMEIAFTLNVIYIILSLIFLKSSFNKVLDKGLAKLY